MDLFKATPINEQYHYGMLGEFKVVIRTSDNYINITKLCADGGKEFRKWKSKKGPQEYLAYFDKNELNLDSPDQDCQESEYKCIDWVHLDQLKGIPSETAKIIQGTYAHMDVAIYVAQWVSYEFAIKVSKIVRSYYNRELILERDDLKSKNSSLEKRMEEMEARLTQKINTQTDMLKESEENNQKRHEELKGIINSAIKYLKSEDTKSNKEMLLMYRLKEEAKDILHIHAGKRSSFKIPKAENCDYLFIGDNISNSKGAIRYLKKENILPSNGTSSTYKIPKGSKRKELYKIVNGINEEYKKIVDSD